jgi:hypothetical protein
MNNIRQTTVPIRDKEGKTITSIEGQIQRWKEYLKEILNTSTPPIGEEEQSYQQALHPLRRGKLCHKNSKEWESGSIR